MCLLRRVSCTMHRLWSLFYAITTCKGCDPWFLMVSSIAPSHWQALSAHPFPRQSPQTQNYCDMVAIVALFVLQASAVPTCGLYGVSPWRTELVKNSVGQMWSCRETSRKSSRIPPPCPIRSPVHHHKRGPYPAGCSGSEDLHFKSPRICESQTEISGVLFINEEIDFYSSLRVQALNFYTKLLLMPLEF